MSLCGAAGCVPDPTFESADATKVLHVQHEDKLYDDRTLRERLSAERDRGVVIVVTEHTASETARSWDHLVDIWVTHTSTGFDWLTRRCPRGYVTKIPHGCPTWFPPQRKERPGRTIGTFGFVSNSKGHAALAEALDVVQGSTLLVYGTARSAAKLEAMRRLWAGRPVRHVNEYLPERVVVSELAARADVLVFWYSENAMAASGAVGVGLSAGVPVITSPTSWFADLRSCTYQPDSLAEGISAVLDGEELRKSLRASARLYCFEHSWPEMARRHRSVWAEAMETGQLV